MQGPERSRGSYLGDECRPRVNIVILCLLSGPAQKIR